MSSPGGSCGGSESLEAVDALVRLLGFSVSAFSASSGGSSGSTAGDVSAVDASPSAIGDLADDARRRFHVLAVTVREATWSFLGRGGPWDTRRKELRKVAGEEAFSSDRDRRMTWERIGYFVGHDGVEIDNFNQTSILM